MPLVSRAAITKRDRSYLLHWVLLKLTPLIPDLRRLALEQFPNVAFEEIGLCVDLTCWPMSVQLHPLQLAPNLHDRPELRTPRAMHFRNLALRRVQLGNGNATLLTILHNRKRGRSVQYAVVELDKNPPEAPLRSENSPRKFVLDSNHNPIAATRDNVDVILAGLNRVSRLQRKSIWSTGLLRSQVRAVMIHS